MEDEYIIKYKKSSNNWSKIKNVKERYKHLPYIMARLTPEELEELSTDSNVEYIEKNSPVYASEQSAGQRLTNLHLMWSRSLHIF